MPATLRVLMLFNLYFFSVICRINIFLSFYVYDWDLSKRCLSIKRQTNFFKTHHHVLSGPLFSCKRKHALHYHSLNLKTKPSFLQNLNTQPNIGALSQTPAALDNATKVLQLNTAAVTQVPLVFWKLIEAENAFSWIIGAVFLVDWAFTGPGCY